MTPKGISPGPARPASDPLPWFLVLLVFGVILGCALIGVLVAGPSYAPAFVAGAVLGLFGVVFGDRRKTFGVAAVVLAVTLAQSVLSDLAGALIAIPVLAFCAGRELSMSGTRVAVFGIMAWIMLTIQTPHSGDGMVSLAGFVLSCAIGSAAALLLGAEARVPRIKVAPRYAMVHAAALGLGLGLAYAISAEFDDANVHWIALLFAARALDPPGTHMARTTRRGLATIIGAGVAGLVVTAPAAPILFKAVGVLCAVIGVRYLPSGRSLASALMSAGVVLATAPTAQTALFRMEAAAIAAGLVVLVFVLASFVGGRLGARHGRSDGPSDPT